MKLIKKGLDHQLTAETQNTIVDQLVESRLSNTRSFVQ